MTQVFYSVVQRVTQVFYSVVHSDHGIFIVPFVFQNLTGGVSGGKHLTDVTNASRTMLMNIHTLQWDDSLCR